MNDEEIIQVVENALKQVATEQKRLLKTGRVERSFSTRLRDKLLPIFQTDTITVDAPYNRHGKETKRLNGGAIELDFAVHEPFTDANNILAIEIETNNNPDKDDINKLIGLTQGDGDYKYRLGLFVVFGIKLKAGEILEMIWYKNGEVLNETVPETPL